MSLAPGRLTVAEVMWLNDMPTHRYRLGARDQVRWWECSCGAAGARVESPAHRPLRVAHARHALRALKKSFQEET